MNFDTDPFTLRFRCWAAICNRSTMSIRTSDLSAIHAKALPVHNRSPMPARARAESLGTAKRRNRRNRGWRAPVSKASREDVPK